MRCNPNLILSCFVRLSGIARLWEIAWEFRREAEVCANLQRAKHQRESMLGAIGSRTLQDDDLVSQGEDLNLEREARSKGYEEGLE